jgi:hypothetical protein
VLDLYLSGDFDREMLMERKTRLKTMIDDLEREQAELTVRLEAQALTDERIEGIMARMAKMRKGLEKAEGDFKKQR